ncbi:DUF1287 domain-containing protein [Roseibacillus ishigakijimensis]|uniref:DUF1287 domain-containing protein n=1 Tax=Roseibacillus ishigakijimensis TaxID=454146 RepID=A0A934RRV7_9BACT|nr:DUF1287 domain-containing protein [Roseibacillus ishigakijimensis]MBK1834506.1 DUF1287 domain-containing protein [Roseibacillus ishigakijimensis]
MKLKPIEYIGPAPTVKKPRSGAGGWLLIGFAALLAFLLARPFFQLVQAQQSEPNATTLEAAGRQLDKMGTFGAKLAKAALARTQAEVVYDLTYRVIDFPNGDIPADRGKAEDVIIRSYRALGTDLQLLLNDDMSENFREYPRYWGMSGPDPNIDHRRTPNLQRFFVRFGESIPPSNSSDDYDIGDIVVWHLPEQSPQRAGHIGIVVPGPGKLSDEKWVVHNNGSGPRWENELFSYPIIGHYRYIPESLLVDVDAEGELPMP